MKDETSTPSADSESSKSGGKGKSTGNSFLRIFTYADRVSWFLNGCAIVSAVGAGTILPLMDLIFGRTITTFTSFGQGSLTAQDFSAQLIYWTLWFIYLFVAKFALTYIWSFSLNLSAIRTTKALRVDLLRQTLRQDLAFYDSNDSGSVSIHVTTNGNLINTGISEKMGIIIQGLSTFIAAFIVAFTVNWKLTLITLAVVPTILVVTGICLQIEIGLDVHILKSYAEAGSLADEVFASIKTVHAFWAHPSLAIKYASYLKEARKVGLKKNLLYGFYYATDYFTIYAGYGLAFWQGSRRYASGEIKRSGDIVTVIFAVILAATALTQVIPQSVHISKATSAAAELFEIIDRKPLIDSLDESGLKPQSCQGLVELRDIRFSYPTRPDVPVLQGMNLTLHPGKTTAIVGASGSGKSTIVALLERWYDPSSGSISIDHQKIEELNIEWLRTNVRVVQQEPTLFNTSIFHNVAYGLIGTVWESSSLQKKMELVVEACKSANCHDFIEQQPEGYDTLVGERASRLSGGQKQRIAIARSIISAPKILLLDEATSALDPKAEKIVQDVLDQVSATRTTLIIAHKLSTVRKADNIVVMKAGAIIEQGSHSDLVRADGPYARLVRAQDLGGGTDQQEGSRIERQLTRAKTGPLDDAARVNQETSEKTHNIGLLKVLGRTIKEKPALWPQFWIIFLGCVVGGGGFPVSAVLFAKAINVFTLSGDELVKQGDFWALMFFVVALGILIIYSVLGFASNKASQELAYDYRLDMFRDFARQDMAFFDKPENTTGAIVSRLSSYPTQFQDLMSLNISLILISLVQIVASSVLAIAYAWKIGLVVVFGGLTVFSFAGYLRIRLENMLDESTTQKFADSAALASEATDSIRTVSSLALEKTILKEYQDRLAHVERESIKTLIWTMFWFALTQSVNLLAMALGFWYGSTLVAKGEYSLEQFYVAFTAVLFSGEGAATMFQYSTSVTKGSSAASYMFWLKDSKPSIGELGPGHELVSSEKTGLNYNDVRFSYPARPDIPVLLGIDIDVHPGSSVALVGPSGCGKSTMLALAERFYDVNSGTIAFDGQDISKVCPRELRSNIALVSQEPTLYQGSIRENVLMGLETASDEQIEKACKLANIHDFIISLPESYATPCGNRGTSLSGGQRQRIAIARALIRKPKLLCLDEATSALDTESEKIVQEALERGRENCTTVAIAHRLSTIKDYNMIYVFGKGRVIEAGTHRELLAKGEVYYEMCLGQGLDSQ